ncbi:MAG: 30S ribosomal protein S1 [Bacteroidetes bacterium]|nr:30S ribosomal protein S1 [Bacteroidota bacterium]
MSNSLIIAIDGPAASGKSTTARLVAKALGYIYADTGAMYRAVTWLFIQNGINPGTVKTDEILKVLAAHPIRLQPDQDIQRVFAGDTDVTDAIRMPDVTSQVSAVSAIPAVRKEMVRLQQALGRNGGLVMDGRDIGTVVFPGADLKIFMVADPAARARRRQKELEAKGQTVNFEQLLEEIRQRDHSDSTRNDSPLRPAADAIHLDNSQLSVEEQVEWVVSKARQVMNTRRESTVLTGGKLMSNNQKSRISVSELEAGAVVSAADLHDDSDYSFDDLAQLSALYDQTVTNLKEGQIVKGRVISVSDRDVRVDIGFKSDGVVPIQEFHPSESPKIGTEVEVFLESVENREGILVLSKKRADFYRIWQKITNAYEKDEIIRGRISRRIKGGMVVDLIGVEAFLPGSQIDVRPIRDFDALVGQEMDFKVVKINQPTENVVVSHKVLIEKDLENQRGAILQNLEAGQVLEGVVKNITDFGVFIDLGGVDGLLHITDLSWGRVNHPSEVVSLDQTLNVVILDFDKEKKRISLGLKQLQPHPWENIDERFPIGTKVSGKVVSLADYGAFIEIDKGIEGLIHISEMSWTQHIKHPSEKIQMGQQVDCVILSIDKDNKKISLGMKQLEEDPWENLLKKYPVDVKTRGTVRNITNFGVFVELEPGVDGLVHVSDLSWTKKVRHPGEIVKKGDVIDVTVIGIDSENRRISLGMKQLEENPWETFENVFPVGTPVTAKVSKVNDKSLVVALPYGLEGFIPQSHLVEKNNTSQHYKNDQELTCVVIELNTDERRVIVSETEASNLSNKEAMKAIASAASANETAMATALKEAGLTSKKKPASKKKDDSND